MDTETIAAIATAATTSFLLFLDQRAKTRISDTATLRERLARAEAARDEWREKYMTLREDYIAKAEAELDDATE